MASIPKKSNAISTMTTANLVNAISNEVESVSNYKIGQIKSTGTAGLAELRAIGDTVTGFAPIANAFLSALVNRIAEVRITSKLYENPWAAFKKGVLALGESIEEIFVSLANPYQYNIESEDNPFKRYIPDVRAAFHSLNFQKFYPCTVSQDDLRQAFLSWNGINDLISRIIEQVYTGANYDEFLIMKYMLAKRALNGDIYSVNIDSVTADNARQITSAMNKYAKNLSYMGNTYNYAGVTTYTDIKDLYMILTTDVSSIFDVEVLAMSFNMDKAELLGRQIGVDGFGTIDSERLSLIFADDPYTDYVPLTDDELNSLSSIAGLMVDKNYFMIFDNFMEMTEIYNPKNLKWNYFYHKWTTFSVSPFANAILFTTDTVAVNSVTVSPNTATVAKGGTVQLSAVVDVTGFADKGVTWSVDSDTSAVSASGLVTVSADETETTLTVTATSIYDSTKTGTATITVSGN